MCQERRGTSRENAKMEEERGEKKGNSRRQGGGKVEETQEAERRELDDRRGRQGEKEVGTVGKE